MTHLQHTPTGPWRRLASPAGVLGVLSAAVAYLAVVDPNEPGHFPGCPFLTLTGYYCPGCGGLRMVHSLTTGRPGEAFGHNPLAFLLIPVAGYLWVRWAVCSARGRAMRSALFHPWVLAGFGVLVLVYWVVRNLPPGRALAP